MMTVERAKREFIAYFAHYGLHVPESHIDAHVEFVISNVSFPHWGYRIKLPTQESAK